jgi:hypothetical protein
MSETSNLNNILPSMFQIGWNIQNEGSEGRSARGDGQKGVSAYLLQVLQLMQLHTQQSHIDRVLHHNPSHKRIFLLPDTEDTTESLLFNGVVPPKIERNASVGPGEVKAVYRQ